MDLFLTGLSGLAWTMVYIAAIRVGFRDKTYAMPMAALGLNIAWEWIYAIYDLSTAPGAQALHQPRLGARGRRHPVHVLPFRTR